MYRISVRDEKSRYELTELARMFLSPNDFAIHVGDERGFEASCAKEEELLIDHALSKNAGKRQLYDFFAAKLGKTLDWGILTGVRPSKLYGELLRQGKDPAQVLEVEYAVSREKIALLEDIYRVQAKVDWDRDPKAVGIYIGIPFCPSRCQYCSFTSNKISGEGSKLYLEALFREIAAVKDLMTDRGYRSESVYIGGGTPTSLEDGDFEALMANTSESFLGPGTREFTVEAGRPETISSRKLGLIKAFGANRISINPQTMKTRTLELIGRHHSPEQIKRAFVLARRAGIEIINADLIAGLPEESPEDFRLSLEEVLKLAPENITVHTLAVKRASRLIEEDGSLALRQASNTAGMLEIASEMLRAEGYLPYYMYRQKQMSGNLENVGWCKPGKAGLYNIRIMEENQTVIAMGAGAISKVYFPRENRIERVPNVSDFRIYARRIDEMIDRKREGIL